MVSYPSDCSFYSGLIIASLQIVASLVLAGIIIVTTHNRLHVYVMHSYYKITVYVNQYSTYVASGY